MIRYQARYSAYIGLVTDSYPRRLFEDSAADWAEEGYRVPRSGGTEVVTCVIIVLGIASVIWNIVLSNELRSKSDPALVTAERQLEDAAHTYENSVALCGSGAKGLSCLETAGSAWGESFDRFASSLSRVSFSGSQREQAAALGHDARTVGHALRSASNSQTGSEYAKAVLAAQRLLPTFEADAKSLLGHGL
jgi:hypothetical protein